jgi:hypothetical protein
MRAAGDQAAAKAKLDTHCAEHGNRTPQVATQLSLPEMPPPRALCHKQHKTILCHFEHNTCLC